MTVQPTNKFMEFKTMGGKTIVLNTDAIGYIEKVSQIEAHFWLVGETNFNNQEPLKISVDWDDAMVVFSV